MIFKKIAIENYKSFRYRTEIKFPTPYDSNRVIFLIGGMNGAGKTSIMEAINYCLFGVKPEVIFRNINRKEKSHGNISVTFELEFIMDDLSEITVKRSWSSGTILNPKPRDLTEKLEIIKNGERISAQTQYIWQEFIKSAIPPAITQFFFFDGEKIQDFAADDYAELRLKNSLEAALGLQDVNQLLQDIKRIKQKEQKNFVKISDEDLKYKQSELELKQSKLNNKLKDRKEIQEEIDVYKFDLDESKGKFEAIFHVAPESKEKYQELEKRKIDASSRLAIVDSKIRRICEEWLAFGLLGDMFDQIRKQIDLEHEFSSNEAIKKKSLSLAKRIVQVLDIPEPLFQEKLSPEKKVEFEKRVYHLLHDDQSNKDVKMLLNLSERDSARVLYRIESVEKSEELSLLQPLLEEKYKLTEEKSNLENITDLSLFNDPDRDIFNQMQTEIESLSSQIGRKSEKQRLIEDEIISYQKKIGDIEQEIEKLYGKYEISREISDFIDSCDKVVNVLNEFIVDLRKKKVLLLQEKTFEMYRLLSNRSDQITNIVIDQDSYEVKITDGNGQEIRKSALSAGEKEVFAISLLWGLAQSSQVKLPIIIDTPLSRLDSTHRENIVNYYFPHSGDQVIILSTDTEIDNNYYKKLKDHLVGAGKLEYDKLRESTYFQEGYFWEN